MFPPPLPLVTSPRTSLLPGGGERGGGAPQSSLGHVVRGPCGVGVGLRVLGGGAGLGLGEPFGDGCGLGLPGIDPVLDVAVLGVREQGGSGSLRGVEPSPERGVGEPAVGLLAAPRRQLLGAHRLGGVGEQSHPAFQQGCVRGDAAGFTASCRQLGFQARLFPIEPFPPRNPGGRAALGLLPRFEPLALLPFGDCEGLARGVHSGGGTVRMGMTGRQLGYQLLEFDDGWFSSMGTAIDRPGSFGVSGIIGSGPHHGERRGTRRRVLLPYGSELAVRLRTRLLGPPVHGESRLLGCPVDMPVRRTRGIRVVARPADLAGLAVDEFRREFGGDVAQPLFAQPKPPLVCAQGALAGRGQPVGRIRRLGRERVAATGRVQAAASRLKPSRKVFGAGRGLLCRLDAFLQFAAGGLPARQPAFRFLDQLVVGAGLAFQFGPLGVDLRVAPLGSTRGVETAELLPEPAFQGCQLLGTRVDKGVGQLGAGAVTGLSGSPVGTLGVVAQLQCWGNEFCLARPFEPLALPVALGAAGFELTGAATRLLVPLLESGELACGVEFAAGEGLPALGGGEYGLGDVEPFPGVAAGRRSPLQYAVRESRIAGPGVRQGQFTGSRSGSLGDSLGDPEDLLVPGLDLRLGGAAQFGEPFLDGRESAGVEEPAEQFAAGFGVGAQEACEVALRQQHHLAELVPAHPDELGDLLADLLVGAAERPPAVLGVVLAQPALRLLRGEALALLLGAGLGRAPGDLQMPSADGQFQPDLGGEAGRGVIAAQ